MVRAEVAILKAAGKPIAPVPPVVNRVTKARDLIDAALDRANSHKQTRRAKRLQAALDQLPKA